MDMGYLLSFLAGMCIAIVICDIISHKFFKRKRNKVHFYVARDKNETLWLYFGKPIRKENEFGAYNILRSSCYFKDLGLNADDYKDLRWEDEPVEVFLNMENFSEHEQHKREERLKMIENLMKNGENK